jgi:DNA-binding transcriptional MerR regulator
MEEKNMLTIGEFSKLSKVSTQTLRYYNSINLLKPAWIDKENDYRYYTFDQLEQILMINKLKEYQFPLIEILSILNKDNNEYLITSIKQKHDELTKQLESQKQLILQMENDLDKIMRGGKLMSIQENIDLKIIKTESVRIASIRRRIREEEGTSLFMELVGLVEQNNFNVCGEPISIYHNNEHDDSRAIDMEVGVPVTNEDNKCIRILEGSLCIYTKFIGNYNDLEKVYIPMFAWKEEENYELVAAPYQKYIKTSYDTKNPQEYITEIYLPVRKRS